MRTKLIQSDGFHRIQWLIIRTDGNQDIYLNTKKGYYPNLWIPYIVKYAYGRAK